MESNDLNALLKSATKSNVTPIPDKKVTYSKRALYRICRSLSHDTSRFDPQITLSIIGEYTSSTKRLPRVLYSEITNYVYSLSSEERGSFATNVEHLLDYVMTNSNSQEITSELQEMVIRIYDHCQLAIHQSDNIVSSFASGIEDTKQDLANQFKGIEKEYISILGIFSSVVLAFVGGLTFSTSVLENIDKASIYRQVIISCIIGLVFFDLVWLMVDLIRSVNGKVIRNKWIFLFVDAIFIGGIFFTAFAHKYGWFL